MGPWRKARRQDWERSPGAWTPNAASCATGEGSQGNAGGRTEGERKEREGESREGAEISELRNINDHMNLRYKLLLLLKWNKKNWIYLSV